MQTLQQKIGYHFKDTALLELALTHPSLSGTQNNQRLEFLGDAVLSSVVAELIYAMYPNEQEGELALRHSALVRSETLATIAQDIALGTAIKMASGEEAGGGRENPATLEDTLEALVGAIYLDGGYAAAKSFIEPRWQELAKTVKAPPKDAKTALQEWAQGRGLPLPEYELLETEGAAHDPVFTVRVSVQGQKAETAQAKSKRNAQQEAANKLLLRLEEQGA